MSATSEFDSIIPRIWTSENELRIYLNFNVKNEKYITKMFWRTFLLIVTIIIVS